MYKNHLKHTKTEMDLMLSRFARDERNGHIGLCLLSPFLFHHLIVVVLQGFVLVMILNVNASLRESILCFKTYLKTNIYL